MICKTRHDQKDWLLFCGLLLQLCKRLAVNVNENKYCFVISLYVQHYFFVFLTKNKLYTNFCWFIIVVCSLDCNETKSEDDKADLRFCRGDCFPFRDEAAFWFKWLLELVFCSLGCEDTLLGRRGFSTFKPSTRFDGALRIVMQRSNDKKFHYSFLLWFLPKQKLF